MEVLAGVDLLVVFGEFGPYIFVTEAMPLAGFFAWTLVVFRPYLRNRGSDVVIPRGCSTGGCFWSESL
jgi:hypothetical protein